MTVSVAGTIDFIAHDPAHDEALLVMVEDRGWGDAGTLLPDLEAKLNVYLDYVTSGQLQAAYPDLVDKPIHFQLRSLERPGKRELEYLRVVATQDLSPRGIRLSFKVIGETLENAVNA
ncbi:MAG TPA: DUF6572 domain-containing protein [Blastocatellia bacterium]|nr:DUF6572 domain-containing protein [Blastocatellia bacterium]